MNRFSPTAGWSALSSNRKIEVAVTIPANLQRSLGVLDSLRANVLARAVIDLTAWFFLALLPNAVKGRGQPIAGSRVRIVTSRLGPHANLLRVARLAGAIGRIGRSSTG